MLLLATSYLGAVSHTLTAVDVLRRRGCDAEGHRGDATRSRMPATPVACIEELGRWTEHSRLVDGGRTRPMATADSVEAALTWSPRFFG